MYKFPEFFLSELWKEGPLCEIDFDFSQFESVCKQVLEESRNYSRIQPPSQVTDCPATYRTCKVLSPGMAQAVCTCIWRGISHAAVFAVGAATEPNFVSKLFTCKFKDAAVSHELVRDGPVCVPFTVYGDSAAYKSGEYKRGRRGG